MNHPYLQLKRYIGHPVFTVNDIYDYHYIIPRKITATENPQKRNGKIRKQTCFASLLRQINTPLDGRIYQVLSPI